MNHYLIIIDAIDLSQYDGFGESLRQLGHECHVLSNTWALRTGSDPQQIEQFISGGLADPRDKFIVAPTVGEWLPHNCKSYAECYD